MDRTKEKRGVYERSDESSTSSAESTEFSYKKFRPKKKPVRRRSDAGRRYQRGRVYDSAFGITCHFCRQKTTDKHVVCCSGICVLAFCGNCLQNRHGEDIHIETADDNYSWICPKCRGGCGQGCKNCCNCTFCRKAQNLRPPKILYSEMQARGFDNVHDYLIHLEIGESPESISARKLGKGWCLTYEKGLSKTQQSKEKADANDRDTSKGSCKMPHSATHGHNEKDATKGLNENVCSGVWQDQCPAYERSMRRDDQNMKGFATTKTDEGNGSHEDASSHGNSVLKSPMETYTRKGLNEDICSGVGQDQCPAYERSMPRDDQNMKGFATTETDEGKGSHEAASSHGNSVLKSPMETHTRKGSYNGAKSLNCQQIEKDARSTDLNKLPCSVTSGTLTDKDIFSLLFCSRDDFKVKLEKKLQNSFDSEELKELIDAIKCRKPVYKPVGTPEGAHSFLLKEAGHSYIDHYPDLARKITATSNKEEKLKLLRGFFFWLEHSSMSGSFKPWLETDNDAECVELVDPDFQVLGVLINLDEQQHGKEQEGKPAKAKHDIKESFSMHAHHGREREETGVKAKLDIRESLFSQGRIVFNWDEEDVKPSIKEELAKFPSFNTRIHVKEEPDA